MRKMRKKLRSLLPMKDRKYTFARPAPPKVEPTYQEQRKRRDSTRAKRARAQREGR